MNRQNWLACVLRAAFVACVMWPLSAPASQVVDQSFLWYGQDVYTRQFAPAFYSLGQTFTVGLSGRLTGIDLAFSAVTTPGTLAVEIRSTSNGVPLAGNANVLSTSTPVSSINTGLTLTHFDLPSGGVSVNAGDVLAVDISASSTILQGFVEYGPLDQYSGGAAYINSGGAWHLTSSPPYSDDLFFQTYVEAPVAVPQPTSAAIFGLALFGLVARGGLRTLLQARHLPSVR